MILTLFESTRKAYLQSDLDFLDGTWNEVAEFLSIHHDIEKKDAGMLFNLAHFKDLNDPSAEPGRQYVYENNERTEHYKEIANTVRRCRANLLGIWGIVLDFDKNTTIEQAIELYDGLEYLLYTTFNHVIDRHRFRIVIPFTRELLASDIDRKITSIKNTFKHVDQASFSMSQGFYLHAGHNDPIVYHNRGVMIDPYDFEDAEVERRVIVAESFENDWKPTTEFTQAIRDSLMSCRDLGYTKSLQLVAICKSSGIDFAGFNEIVERIAGHDSHLRKDKSSRASLWNSDYKRITRLKRDEFIKDHGGRLPRLNRDDRYKEYIEDLALMKKIETLIKEKRNVRQ